MSAGGMKAFGEFCDWDKPRATLLLFVRFGACDDYVYRGVYMHVVSGREQSHRSRFQALK